jgi:hypothetical protein
VSSRVPGHPAYTHRRGGDHGVRSPPSVYAVTQHKVRAIYPYSFLPLSRGVGHPVESLCVSRRVASAWAPAATASLLACAATQAGGERAPATVPSRLNLGRDNGHAVPARSRRLWRDRGPASGGRRAGCSRAVCTPTRRSRPLSPASGDIGVGIPPGSGGFMNPPVGSAAGCCPARRAGLRRVRRTAFRGGQCGHRSRPRTSTASIANTA